jgi:hypothetical protein
MFNKDDGHKLRVLADWFDATTSYNSNCEVQNDLRRIADIIDEKKTHFAQLSWSPEDVFEIRPDWSQNKCLEELLKIEDEIIDRMVETGWSVLEDLLPEE